MMHDFSPLNSAVLGRILMLQSTLQAAPDEACLMEMLVCGISDLPGVLVCGACLEGTLYRSDSHGPLPCLAAFASGMERALCPSICACMGMEAGRRIELRTSRQQFGSLCLKTRDQTTLASYLDFIQNTVNLVALHLENNRNAAQLIALNRDLDEKVREKTRQLQASEERFVRAMEASQDGVWDWNVQTGDVYYSPGYAAMLGYSVEELSFWVDFWKEHLHPDDRDRTLKVNMDCVENRCNTFEVEFRMLARNGDWRWILGRGKAISRDPNGRATRIVGTHTDITDRKQAQQMTEKRLFALTQPLETTDGITFEALFNLQDIQRLQDEFAQATGVASIITHPDGTPITAPSNFCRFCKNIIRQTEKGRANCYKSDSVIGSPSPDGPRIHPCMSGSLWDAGTDISVGGRHIANWLIGQVRDSTQTEERICAYAREIGADETATLEAFREVPAMSRERFGQVAQVLYTIARQISTTAYQNLQQARFITEHERVEEALKKSEALLAKSQEIAHLGSWELDRFTDTLTWSDEVFRIFGFEPQEFKPDYATFLQCIHPEDRIGVDAAYLDSLRNGENRYTIEHRVLCQPTGEVRHVQERCVHVRNETGEVVRSIGMVQDITERKQTEETLAFLANFSTSANGDFFHALAEYLARALGGDFVCIDRLEADRLTASTVAVYADGQFQDNVSYTLKDTPCGAVVDRRICCFPEGVRRLFPHDEVLQELQAEGYAGITLWSYAGHPIGLIAVIGRRPYTNPGLVESVLGIVAGRAASELERRQAEEERLALERQVQHAQKLESLGVLAGGIAHDFNNLLMAILGNADLALDALSPMSPARGNILEVEKAAKRAADLAKQMLAYSGKGHFVIEPIDAGKLVEDMAHLLEVSISKKVVLKYNFAPNLPTFDGDATQIRQIILNLITNASEAIGEKSGVIALSTGAMSCDRAYLDGTNEVFRSALSDPLPEGIYVYFEVADTGNGMDGGTLDKIFDPFFTTKFTGRGLGLSAVLGIVRGHRGTIKIYSEPRRGTTFKVLFPANELPENGTAWKPETSTELQWNGSGTVLIADDEESVCAVGTQMLTRIGFRVLTAPDGRQAVTTFREHADEIVCVLLDLTMPHMDGEETFREMRRIRPDVTVLLCSGYNEQDAMQRFSGKGVAGFIQKPYGMNELKKRLQEILQARGSVGV